MTSTITISEIQSRFVEEWVLVGDPQVDATQQISRGHALCHSKDRDEVYRRAVASHPARLAILFAAKIPQGTAIVL